MSSNPTVKPKGGKGLDLNALKGQAQVSDSVTLRSAIGVLDAILQSRASSGAPKGNQSSGAKPKTQQGQSGGLKRSGARKSKPKAAPVASDPLSSTESGSSGARGAAAKTAATPMDASKTPSAGSTSSPPEEG